MNQGKKSSQEIKMQGLIDRYLHNRISQANLNNNQHLDEDYLNAFVEGTISERESSFVVKHLADCSYCLHITGDLMRLQDHFSSADEFQTSRVTDQPAKISEVLSGLLSRVFGTNDGAVFAHQEDQEKQNSDSSTDDKATKSS